MIHNHVAVSTLCQMIMVTTNDGLIPTYRKVYVAMVEHSRSRATMQVQFDEAIPYAAEKLEIECFEQLPMATCTCSCTGNGESGHVYK